MKYSVPAILLAASIAHAADPTDEPGYAEGQAWYLGQNGEQDKNFRQTNIP